VSKVTSGFTKIFRRYYVKKIIQGLNVRKLCWLVH